MQITAQGRVIGSVGPAGVWYKAPADVARCVVNPPAGQAGWFSETECAYQAGDAELRFFDVVSWVDRGTNDRLGVSLVRGAAGQYGVWLATATGGVRGSVNLPDAKGILGAADDGTLFVISADYSAIEAYTNGAQRWVQPGSFPVIFYPAPQFSCIDADRVCWWNAQAHRLETRGLNNPVAQTWGTPTDAFIALVNDELYLGYHSDRAYLHKFSDKSRGWVIANGLTYYTTGRALDGNILCAWSRTQDESVIETRTIDPTSPMEDLTGPPPQPEPGVPIIVKAPFTHQPKLAMFFSVIVDSGTGEVLKAHAHPLACDVLIRETFSDLVEKKPVLASVWAAPSVPDEYLLGIYWSPESGGESIYQESLSAAMQRSVDFVVYSDTDWYPNDLAQRIRAAYSRSVPMVRGYPQGKKPSEPVHATPQQDADRIRGEVRKLRQMGLQRVWVAIAGYNQRGVNGDPVVRNYPWKHIDELFTLNIDIVREELLDGAAVFNLLRDPDANVLGRPELWQGCVDMQAAVPATIPIPPHPIPIPPHPTPTPPGEGTMYYGQRIQIRLYDETDAGKWVKMVVVRHQDENMLDDVPQGQKKSLIYGLSTNFPSGAGKYQRFKGSESGVLQGTFDGTTDDPPGSAERVTFPHPTLMLARPNCAHDSTGVARVYEVMTLS